MNRTRTTAGALLLTAVTAATLMACSDPGPVNTTLPGSAAPTPSAAPTGGATSPAAPTGPPTATATTVRPRSTAVPTMTRPGRPPKTPTDIVKTAGWIEGIVTRGGSGPCYGLTDFDGVEYALYSAEGRELATGDQIRAKVTPAVLRISCGTGQQMQADDIVPLG